MRAVYVVGESTPKRKGCLDVLDAITRAVREEVRRVSFDNPKFDGRPVGTRLAWTLPEPFQVAVHLEQESPSDNGMLPYFDPDYEVTEFFGESMLFVTYSLVKYKDGVAIYKISESQGNNYDHHEST